MNDPIRYGSEWPRTQNIQNRLTAIHLLTSVQSLSLRNDKSGADASPLARLRRRYLYEESYDFAPIHYLCRDRQTWKSLGASHEIHVTQPGVSQQMRLLQEEYGIKLYERTAKGVDLTKAGRSFLSAVSPILDQVERLAIISTGPAAEHEPNLLAIGGTYSSSTILLPSLLSRFKKLHPKTDINFRTNDGSESERLLLKQNIDIAVTTTPPKSPRIMAEPFRREKLTLVVSRSHPLARVRIISLRDIQRTPLLVRSSGEPDGATVKQLKSFAENEGIRITIGIRFESPAAMKEAIQRNMGIGILYEDVARYDLNAVTLRRLKIRGLKLEGQSHIIF